MCDYESNSKLSKALSALCIQCTLESFEIIPKTHQMFSIHITPEEFTCKN